MSIVSVRFLLSTLLLIFAVDNAELVLLTERNSETNLVLLFRHINNQYLNPFALPA